MCVCVSVCVGCGCLCVCVCTRHKSHLFHELLQQFFTRLFIHIYRQKRCHWTSLSSWSCCSGYCMSLLSLTWLLSKSFLYPVVNMSTCAGLLNSKWSRLIEWLSKRHKQNMYLFIYLPGERAVVDWAIGHRRIADYNQLKRRDQKRSREDCGICQGVRKCPRPSPPE